MKKGFMLIFSILLLLGVTLFTSCDNNTENTTINNLDNTSVVTGDFTTIEPTESTTIEPTESSTIEPTESSTIEPTESSTIEPTESSTIEPTQSTTIEPTESSTIEPTQSTTIEPTESSTIEPTESTIIVTYQVIFDANGGSFANGTTYTYDTLGVVEAITVPTRINYTFTNWYKDSSCTQEFDFTAPVTSLTTIYAGWKINQATITFVTNGARDIAPIKADVLSEITIPTPIIDNPAMEFAGWYLDIDFNKPFSGNTMPTADTVLYAKWNTKFHLSLANASGSSMGKLTGSGYFYENATVTVKAAPVGSNIFLGWFIGDASEPITQDLEYTFTMPNSDLTLRGRFAKLQNEIAYSAGEGKVEGTSITIEPNSSFKLPVPVLSGYDFIGYYNGNTKVTDENGNSIITISSNISVVAKYEKHVYNLVLTSSNPEWGEVSQYTSTYNNEEYLVMSVNITPGYKLLGWFAPNSMEPTYTDHTVGIYEELTEDLYFEARLVPNTYIITINTSAYVLNDNQSSFEVTYGEAFDFPIVLGKKVSGKQYYQGLSFSGWKYIDRIITDANGHTDAFNITSDVVLEPIVENSDCTYYGSYPQSKVEDTSIIEALNSKADQLTWQSLELYDNGTPSNYTKYIDIEYNGNKYRGIYFTSYRPSAYSSSTSKYFQSTNGYSKNTTYWFKWEPIKWLSISLNSGYGETTGAHVISEMILDVMEYYPLNQRLNSLNSDYLGNTYSGTNSNSYQFSIIRNWLNTTFISSAFTSNELSDCSYFDSKNNASTTNNSSNDNASQTATRDRVSLLAYLEVKSMLKNTQIKAKATDYAKCLGIEVSVATVSKGCSVWWTRSPDYNSKFRASYVDSSAERYTTEVVKAYGVRPTMCI